MKYHLAIAVSIIMLAGCTKVETRSASVPDPSNHVSSRRGLLLDVGETYVAQVEQSVHEGHTNWMVKNPPMPHHYAVGFEWLNLADMKNPREGLWTFTVKDLERWHSEHSMGDPMGLYHAMYKCNVVKIEDVNENERDTPTKPSTATE